MHETGIGSYVFGQIRGERDHIVIERFFKLVDALDREGCFLTDGVDDLGWNIAVFGVGLAGGDFDV